MPIPDIGRILGSRKQIGGDATETAVAKAWLMKHADEYDRVEFEFHLGPGITMPPGTPAWLQTVATGSTQMRADMLLWRGNYATIVEVKGRLGPPTIGQLLTYERLFREDRPQIIEVSKVAAGLSIQAGMEPAFYHWGIAVELFPQAAYADSANS
jgi:hypothetical protein